MVIIDTMSKIFNQKLEELTSNEYKITVFQNIFFSYECNQLFFLSIHIWILKFLYLYDSSSFFLMNVICCSSWVSISGYQNASMSYFIIFTILISTLHLLTLAYLLLSRSHNKLSLSLSRGPRHQTTIENANLN